MFAVQTPSTETACITVSTVGETKQFGGRRNCNWQPKPQYPTFNGQGSINGRDQKRPGSGEIT